MLLIKKRIKFIFKNPINFNIKAFLPGSCLSLMKLNETHQRDLFWCLPRLLLLFFQEAPYNLHRMVLKVYLHLNFVPFFKIIQRKLFLALSTHDVEFLTSVRWDQEISAVCFVCMYWLFFRPFFCSTQLSLSQTHKFNQLPILPSISLQGANRVVPNCLSD